MALDEHAEAPGDAQGSQLSPPGMSPEHGPTNDWRRYALWLALATTILVSVAVVFQGLYNLFFVIFFGQGHWYFAMAQLFVTLAALAWWGSAKRSRPLSQARSRTALAVIASLSLVVFLSLHRLPDYHAAFNQFYFEEAPRVKAFYGALQPKLVSVDDGIVGFALGYPTISGTALAADPEAVRRFQEGTLVDLALERGHDRLTSLVYWRPSGLHRASSRDEILRAIPGFWELQKDFSKLSLQVEYVSRDRHFVILKVGRR